VTTFYIFTLGAMLSVCDTQNSVNPLQYYNVKILFLKHASYLQENTSHLDYRDMSVSDIQWNKICLFWELNEPTNKPYERNVMLLDVKAIGTHSYHHSV
jgi:hypothetical protein